MSPIKIKSDLKYEILCITKLKALINKTFYYKFIIVLISIFFYIFSPFLITKFNGTPFWRNFQKIKNT
jgi:hypothetical protein